MTPYMISKKFLTSTSYPFPANRWGIPSTLSLIGGGENVSDYSSALSKSSTWGNNSFTAQNQLSANGNRIDPRVSEQTNSIVPTTNQEVDNSHLPNQKQVAVGESQIQNRKSGENSWAHVAGKGLDSIPNNERVQFLYDALLSPEGWSKDNVNQDSAWDLPPSPEPIPESSAHSRLNVNNGCDVWQNAKESGNACGSSWDRETITKNKQLDDTGNSWLEFSPGWRNSANEIAESKWSGQQKFNVSLDQTEANTPKACLTKPLTTATHSIPSISSPTPSCIFPNSYSLGPYTHKESQLLHGPTNLMQITKEPGIRCSSPLIANAQLPLDCAPVKPKQQWDNGASVPKETNAYVGSHQVGPQWVAMPNPSISDHHIMSSHPSAAPILAPHMPHTIYKPDQVIWPQTQNQEYQSDYSSGWPNASSSKPKGQQLQLDNFDEINRDSSQPMSPSAVSQIEYAIRAGYLSYNLYNEPLAPNTMLLLNHLLSAINFLHKLLQQQTTLQPQVQINKNAQQQYLLLNGHINKVKQQIQYLQNQITSQQAMYLRQQPTQLPTQALHNLPITNPPAINTSTNMKTNLPDSLLLNFGQLGIGGNQDVNGWKSSNMPSKIQQPNMFMMTPDRQQWSSQVKEPVWHVSNSSTCISPTARLPSDSGWTQHQSVQPHEFEVKSFQSGKPWMAKNMPEYSPSPIIKHKTNPDLINLPKPKIIPRADDVTDADSIAGLVGGAASTWSYKSEGQRNPSDLRIKISQPAVRKDLPWSESRLNSDAWATSANHTSLAKKTSCWDSSWANGAAATPSSSQWSNSNSSTWLVLKNLTPEIDGSTLKTLCLQHGPLENFHLLSNFGFALANYGNKEEAIKAQSNLNNCLLSNTTILAEFTSQSEVNDILTGLAPPATTSWMPTSIAAPSVYTKAPSGKSDCWAGPSSSLWPNGTSALWSGAGTRDRIDPASDLQAKAYLVKGALNMEPI